MLFNLSHGQHIARENAPAADVTRADLAPMAAVAPNRVRPHRRGQLETVGADAAPDRAPEPEARVGKFRYFFPEAAGLPETPEMLARLDALADSMVEDDPNDPDPAARNATTLPPILTYFGQFIDHDITANTDRDSKLSFIDGNVTPADRVDVEAGLVNLRDGALELDSLYGDKPDQHPFLLKLAGLMRHPTFTAKMRLGVPSLQANHGPRPPLPAAPDNATDLPRLRFFLNRGDITLQELQALPDDLRGAFLEPDGAPIGARAIIGDGRNDENLIVAQFHALMLRFHNKLVDGTGGSNFVEARKLTCWHYQWLVVNAYLRAICDEAVLDEVIEKEAPLYHGFFVKHGSTQGATGPKMPMALEFSAAAFRFGHSMTRAVYDYNRIFGEAVAGSAPPQIPVAPFNLLFGFTGNGRMRPLIVPNPQPVTDGPLPVNWVIEWERFLTVDPTRPLRAARKIDTDIAPPMGDLINEGNDPGMPAQTRALFKHLARRNLRRGYRLNLPSAQSAYGAMRTMGVTPFWMLTPQEIASGSPERQDAVIAGGFHAETPLWFYVLKEAEVLGQGEKLGPLGSHLVANTLLGLIIKDKDSYWNAPGGRWSPVKFNASQPVDSLEEMVRFCGML